MTLSRNRYFHIGFVYRHPLNIKLRSDNTVVINHGHLAIRIDMSGERGTVIAQDAIEGNR